MRTEVLDTCQYSIYFACYAIGQVPGKGTVMAYSPYRTIHDLIARTRAGKVTGQGHRARSPTDRTGGHIDLIGYIDVTFLMYHEYEC